MRLTTCSSPDVQVRKRCFVLPWRVRFEDVGVAGSPTLDQRAAQSLAQLLPMLGCGEEAAALAFDALAVGYRQDDPIAAALAAIADEERVHDGLIDMLIRTLAPAIVDTPVLKEIRRLHIGMTRGGQSFHLARIAALDSSVCLLLGRLLRAGMPIGYDRAIAPILRLTRLLKRITRLQGATHAQ